MSRASSRYSVAAERAKRERDDVVLRVFRAPGVLSNDSSAQSIFHRVALSLFSAQYDSFHLDFVHDPLSSTATLFFFFSNLSIVCQIHFFQLACEYVF